MRLQYKQEERSRKEATPPSCIVIESRTETVQQRNKPAIAIMIRQITPLFFLMSISVLLLAISVTSFSMLPQHTRTGTNSFMTTSTARFMILQDTHGNNIAVGSVVRISAPNLKAYQVQPKAFGQFQDGKFVPLSSESKERSMKNLVLPVGMRGVVTKVYDSEGAVSSNLPVQVKFVPGQHVEEGFDPPVPFLMHFETFEIDAVV